MNVNDCCEPVNVAFCCAVLFAGHICTRIEFAFCNKEGICNVHVLDNVRAHALYRIVIVCTVQQGSYDMHSIYL